MISWVLVLSLNMIIHFLTSDCMSEYADLYSICGREASIKQVLRCVSASTVASIAFLTIITTKIMGLLA